jgi:putative transposase
MGRFNRVVALDIAHHVTQRGNARRFILDCDADRAVYLKLLRENSPVYGVALIGYCLMSNHVHLIAVPAKAAGLAEALKQTHGVSWSFVAEFRCRVSLPDGSGTLFQQTAWGLF